jgi:hypothetical protein
MNESLEALLDHLSEKVSVEAAREKEERFKRSLRYDRVDRLPVICSYPLDEELSWQPFPHREIFDDPGKMLYNELIHAFETSITYQDRVGDDLPFTVRANYGTIIVASLLGGRSELRGDDPPWVIPFESKEEIYAVLERDPVNTDAHGIGARVMETYEFYRETLARFPDLEQVVHLVLPDTQSPMDSAELLRGSELFVDFYEDSEFVSRLLTQVADTQKSFLDRVAPLINDVGDGFSHQHATMIKGNVLLRDDSTILVSPQMYDEFVAPQDEAVLSAVGGGGIHSCGKMEQLADSYLAVPSLRSIDLGQPRFNDVDALYAKAKVKKVPLIRIEPTREELTSGLVMERFPTGVTLIYRAPSMDDAAEVVREYKAATESAATGRD